MVQENDQLLTKLCVRLVNQTSEQTAGSGVIYSHPSLNEFIYVLTAAHCLFEDMDAFQIPMEEVKLQFYSPIQDTYVDLVHKINFSLVWTDVENDVAILVLNISEVESITGKLPAVNMVMDRNDHTQFVAKGFPSATDGKEIVSISPSWAQQVPEKDQFQLHINQDFSDEFSSHYRVDGFSGSGIFLYDHEQIYLYGIFTRFLDAGKIIYCQPLTKFDNLLRLSYLPSFSYTFFGSHGISSDFFYSHAERSIAELGPRFNSELNFKLPIAGYFNAISKDSSFRQLVTKIVDKQLSESVYGSGETEIENIVESYYELNKEIKAWFNAISWSGNDQILVGEIIEIINLFEDATNKKESELYEKRYELASGKDHNRNEIRELFSSEISHLGKMTRNLSDFTNELHNTHISLSNHPVLLIKGSAGAGKSHLLGDILVSRNQNGLPTVLLLGQLFLTGKTLWDNILQQLGLSCTQQEFLSALSNIGEQVGSRVLLMVDAINEGAGKTLWHDGLAGFIHECSQYRGLGLVISIRTTYWKTLIPESVKNNEFITTIEHEGFRGNEYEAVKLFSEFYRIKQPNFPLLNPEYSNPLFLHMICKGIKSSPEQVFPQGFQGITKVFGYYLNAVQDRLIKKRDIYDYAPNLVRNALNSFAKACFAYERRLMSLADALELFCKEFPGFPHLLGDLIEESVLIRSIPSRYRWDETDEEEEVVYFAYERFGDFYIAGELIKDFPDRAKALDKFKKDESLGKLIDDGGYLNSGILEALAVLLPERFGLEIFEVFDWVFEEGKNDYSFTNHSIPQWYLNSLKWRRPETIDDDKFGIWADTTDQFQVSDHEYFNFLYEMCAVDNHPFNSERMTRIFMGHSMSERDAFIQQYFHYYNGTDDDGLARPINRLIDWAWRPDISAETSHRSALLVSQALSWILGSTNNGLRDQTTKAMVNLLQDQIPALVELFKRFINIDDKYIAERLCAIAYGCALRAKNTEELRVLAQTVYDNVFRGNNPPAHIFSRDYSRHIIEFTLSKGVILDLSGGNFRPPYNAILPEQYPTKEELKKYEEEKDENGSAGQASRANGKIIHSVINWDFGRYTIDFAIRNFESIAFSFEKQITLFRKELPRGGKRLFSLLKTLFRMYSTPINKRQKLNIGNEEQLNLYWSEVDAFWAKIEGDLLVKLDDEQKKFYKEKLLPYWSLELRNKEDKNLFLDKDKIKTWIAKRVFDLGYDGKIHGYFDNHIGDSYRRSEGTKIERIGKKYQWIAFYEVLGILADNYKIKERYSTTKTSWVYNGPWDLTYRDIDPSFTTKRDREKYNDDDFGLLRDNAAWFLPNKYMHWNNLQPDWADTIADLPDPLTCIQRIDTKGVEWLYLYSSYTWKAPKTVGESRFGAGSKEIWYLFQSFLVPRGKYNNVLNWLQDQEFNGRWLPEASEVSNLLARENYWSPLSKEIGKERAIWHSLEDTNFKVMLPTGEAIGSLDKDYSGAHFGYQMPNKKIFENLGLSYADQDGEFQNPEGEILFSNLSPLGCMIRKDSLQKFLEENNLRIIWTLLGEKNSFYEESREEDIRKSLSGVFTMENRELKDSPIKVSDW